MDGALPLEWSHARWHDAESPRHDSRPQHQFPGAGRTSASPHSRRTVSILAAKRLIPAVKVKRRLKFNDAQKPVNAALRTATLCSR